jgi:hypothetical protein
MKGEERKEADSPRKQTIFLPPKGEGVTSDQMKQLPEGKTFGWPCELGQRMVVK